MTKVVVFGAGGFIGRHLVHRLAHDNELQIVAFDRMSKTEGNAVDNFRDLTNVTTVYGDFFNRDDVSRTIQGADYVFHLISSTNPAASTKDPFIDIDTNVRSSVELFELCVEHGVKKIIFPSSGGTVYGDIDSELISETMVPQPRSPYGIGKLTIEHYLRYFKYTHGLDYIVYRIANPYGPGQNIFGKQGVIPIFMHRFLTNEPVTVYGDGSMVRDYLYIDDLVEMINNSYSGVSKFSEYNLGSGKGESVNELLEGIEQCTGKKASREFIEVPATFVHKSVLDTQRFRDEFGTPNLVNLQDGLRRTWDYVKELG